MDGNERLFRDKEGMGLFLGKRPVRYPHKGEINLVLSGRTGDLYDGWLVLVGSSLRFQHIGMGNGHKY